MHSLNILFIEVTKEVLKFEKFILDNDLHPKNIEVKSVIKSLSKIEKSNDFNELKL